MGHKNMVPSECVGGDYQFNALDKIEVDSDAVYAGSVEARFKANACIHDGCSGQLKIDTSFENTVEGNPVASRSDQTRYEDHPNPHDVKRHKYPHRIR